LHVDDAGHANADPHQRGAVAVFPRQALDGVAHVADDVIASPGNLSVERDFLDQRALLVHGSDAQVRAAQIHSNGKFIHDD
jgi:hypothetical protein